MIRALLIAGLTTTTAAAVAAPITLLKQEIVFDVHSDGTFTEEHFDRVRIEDAQGIRLAGQIPLQYSESLQKLKVLEAYTTTKGGRRVEVAPDRIREQQLPLSSGAPMFSDHKLKIVVFPALEPGATITLRYRRTQLKPEMPGLFAMWVTAEHDVGTEPTSITLRVPAALNLHIDTRAATGGEIESKTRGIREWQWSLAASGTQPEPHQVSWRDLAPFVMASTFASYDDLANAYQLRAAPMSRPSTEIRKLADEVTKEVHEPRAQAEALYNWVSTNIRYVSITTDVGGYVPHEAEAIRQARYGDCKDHVTLLAALLNAKGIRNSAALIQAGASFSVPATVEPGAFNHAITYLPDFDLFVDSTASVQTFGVLSLSVAGKQVLVVDSGNGKPELRRTPMPTAATDWATARSDFTIAADGTVEGTGAFESSGHFQAVDRQYFSLIPKGKMAQFVDRLMGGKGTGAFEAGDPRDLTKAFSLTSTVKLPDYVNLSGPGAMTVPRGLTPPAGSIQSFVRSMTAPAQTTSWICPSNGKQTEVTNIRLPAGLKLSAVPKAVKLSGAFGTYDSSYQRDGDNLLATRTLTIESKEPVCAPEQYADLKTFANGVADDLRAQIVYQ